MYNVTDTDIKAYREIYYEVVKKMIYAGYLDAEIKVRVELVSEAYGISSERYYLLSDLDLLQRLARQKFINGNDNLKFVGTDMIPIEDDEMYSVLELPELKCPLRTDERLSHDEWVEKNKLIETNRKNRL
jgi:hypothetical protein